MSERDDGKPKLPTIHQWLSEWLGIQLPGLPGMPQTVKNLDKAVATAVLSLGDNVKARIDANTGKIQAGGKIEVDDLVRNAEEQRKLENRAAITHVAAEEIKSNPGDTDAKSEIDTDWLNTFSRISEDKSSEDLRSLFGKILAGEIRKPGSFSLRTLHFASALSKNEAEIISSFFAYVFAKGLVPYGESPPGPPIGDRILMQELGLASNANSFGGLAWTATLPPGQNASLLGDDIGVVLLNNSPDQIIINLPCQVLSQTAKDLLAIASPPPMPFEFAKHIANTILKELYNNYPKQIKSDHISVAIVTINKLDGTLRIVEKIILPSTTP